MRWKKKVYRFKLSRIRVRHTYKNQRTTRSQRCHSLGPITNGLSHLSGGSSASSQVNRRDLKTQYHCQSPLIRSFRCTADPHHIGQFTSRHCDRLRLHAFTWHCVAFMSDVMRSCAFMCVDWCNWDRNDVAIVALMVLVCGGFLRFIRSVGSLSSRCLPEVKLHTVDLTCGRARPVRNDIRL